MKVEIIYDENTKAPIGWELSGENKDEIRKLGVIRDLTFWGSGEYAIEYAGRRGGNDAEMDPGILSWKQKKFITH